MSASLLALGSLSNDAVMILSWFLPLDHHLLEGGKPHCFSIPLGNTYRYLQKLFVE